jgi:hypothetical protein
MVVYDGEELMERALECIRPAADYINIVYSEKSYYGDAGNLNLGKLCESMISRGLADEVIHYETAPVAKDDPDRATKRLAAETEKRNAGLFAAQSAGCDYFMTMDTDEFYDARALAAEKQKIIAHPEWAQTFVHILNYGRDPTKRYDGRKWEYFVPFFAKIDNGSRLGGPGGDVPVLVDPTRCVHRARGGKIWVLDNIFMHHFTRVRHKLDDKYAHRDVPKTIDADWIDDEENFITVPDYFGLKKVIK